MVDVTAIVAMLALAETQQTVASWLPGGSVEDWSLRVFLCIAIFSLVWTLRMFVSGSWVVARWSYDKVEQQVRSLEAENSDLNDSVSQLRDELARAREQIAAMSEKVSTMSQNIGRLESEVNYLRYSKGGAENGP